MILYIDTAFDETTLAIKKDKKIFEEKISKNTNISQILIEKTKHIFKKIGVEKEEIDAIGFNNGPGNFTSLRVALAYVKAISYYLSIPVIPINSFQVLLLSSHEVSDENQILLAIDAKMNEVYWVYCNHYSDLFLNRTNFNLTSEYEIYENIKNFNAKNLKLIKNNSNILNNTNKNNLFFDKIIKHKNKENLEHIFSYIEKHQVDNTNEVNLLYVRNNVAKKMI
jgi:tRNA threonylcarbamoyl adenosine modification protein YeaZ|tara:strand:+ start:598 stop:1269 length:672 start_codon:yes stop_codon:yes gene_type:complete